MSEIITGTFRESKRPLTETLEGDSLKQDFQIELNLGRITRINVGVSDEVFKCIRTACNDRKEANNPDGVLVGGVRIYLTNY